MKLNDLFEAVTLKQSVSVNGYTLTLKTLDDFFTACAVLVGQNVTMTTNDDDQFDVVMKGSYSASNGPNAWVQVDGKKIWCQAFKHIEVPVLDKKKLDKIIASISEKLEIEAVSISQYDAAVSKASAKAGYGDLKSVDSEQKKSFLNVIKSIAKIAGESPRAEKKILAPSTKTLQ